MAEKESKTDKDGMTASMASQDEALGEIQWILRTLRYGSITILVNAGEIIQIDVTERRRLRSPQQPR